MTEIEIIVVLLIRGKNTHLLTGWLRPLETQKGKRLWLGLYKLIPKFVFQAEYVFLYQWSIHVSMINLFFCNCGVSCLNHWLCILGLTLNPV